MHGLWDPSSHHFFLRKLFLAAILDRDDRGTRFWWSRSTTATSLLNTKFQVSSAKIAWVISVWKVDKQYYKVYTSDDSKWPPSEVVRENRNKLVHPWFETYWVASVWSPCGVLSPRSVVSFLDAQTYWMALVWSPCGVMSPRSVVSFLLCTDHSEKTWFFQKGRRCITEGHRQKPW